MLSHTILFSTILLTVLTPESQCYTDVYIEGNRADPAAVEGNQQQALWFGPRLGRRKRPSASLEAIIPKTPVLEEAVVSLYDDRPWILEPIRGYQERPAYGAFRERDVEEILENSKAPPFSPRLGRRRKLLPFSPRLGREMHEETSDRFARSAPGPAQEHASKNH